MSELRGFFLYPSFNRQATHAVYVEYLEPEEIVEINRKSIQEVGGDLGLLHRANLEYLCFRAKDIPGNETKKAAYYFHAIAYWAHAFLDGNKRTALASTVKFLEDNGFQIEATEEELARFALDTAQGKITLIKVEQWLKQRIKVREKKE